MLIPTARIPIENSQKAQKTPRPPHSKKDASTSIRDYLSASMFIAETLFSKSVSNIPKGKEISKCKKHIVSGVALNISFLAS
jgi:hypothetical protein